ncbi:VOC family protein [Lentzea pudingi]|uniref:VOC family protein n=1 Tax=Lentzea pudingi TaxID=1789439 RepID=A0ABQ2HCT7_9PSEU|nr:VOC family protein [Lentzea pudingi]GGM74834.1 VOC family protein [Lentzea pudingi]
MALNAAPHLNFRGQAREALEFYRSVFGGRLNVVTYGDFGMPAEVPGAGNVVFGEVVAENGFRVLAYDVPGATEPLPQGEPKTRRENGTTITEERFFLSVGGERVDELTPVWDGLADGATVIEEFGPSRFSPGFGMLADRFGVTWIVSVMATQA